MSESEKESEKATKENEKKKKIENRPMWKIAQKCVYEIYIF